MLAFRQWLAAIFDDQEPRSTAARVFNTLLTALIISNVACVILDSVEPLRQRFAAPFDMFEKIATALFAIEYVLRVWASVDFHNPSYREPLWGRLRYMVSFFALVDLVAVLPALIGFLQATDVRVLRLLRLLRMLKLTRRSTTLEVLWAVVRNEAQSIAALLMVLLLTVIVSGALMYMIESDAQPGVFTSIPVAMWWAIETVTTVGYGDFVPITAAGRILGGAVSVIGVGTLALFSGLITVGFIEQLKIHRERQTKLTVAVSDGLSRIALELETEIAAEAAAAMPVQEIEGKPGICPHCGARLSVEA